MGMIQESNREDSRVDVANRAKRGGSEGGESDFTGFDGAGCSTSAFFLNLRKKPAIASLGEMEVPVQGNERGLII
jgi:hypothetical protein